MIGASRFRILAVDRFLNLEEKWHEVNSKLSTSLACVVHDDVAETSVKIGKCSRHALLLRTLTRERKCDARLCDCRRESCFL